jgi:hypothetical protein
MPTWIIKVDWIIPHITIPIKSLWTTRSNRIGLQKVVDISNTIAKKDMKK